MNITISVPMGAVERLSPDDVARLFANLDGDEQRQFFNALHKRVSEEYQHGVFGFMMQMESVRNDVDLTTGGRLVQKIIGGDY